MEFRIFEKTDLAECAKLYSTIFSGKPWNEDWHYEISYRRLNHIFNSLGFIGVVAFEKKITGMAMGNVEPFFHGDMFYLRDMCVDIHWQRKGVGRQLLEKLNNELKGKGINGIYLATELKYPAAHFYTKNGFNVNKGTGFFSKNV